MRERNRVSYALLMGDINIEKSKLTIEDLAGAYEESTIAVRQSISRDTFNIHAAAARKCGDT